MSTFDAMYRRYSRLEDFLAASPWRAAVIAAIHLTALIILYQTEWGLVHGVLAVLAWALLNCDSTTIRLSIASDSAADRPGRRKTNSHPQFRSAQARTASTP
jgi:hypothetical protein